MNLMTIGCVSALLLVISGCATSPSTTSSAPSPTFKFKLAAKGLPTEGRWKSEPVMRDVNRDGRIDLASHLRLGDEPGIWLGDGRGNWSDKPSNLRLSDNKTCGGGIDIADINKDGQDDLAVADHCTGIYIFMADGQGKWKLTTAELNSAIAEQNKNEEINPYMGAEFLALGDVNEDGMLDLVVSASDRGGFSVFLGDGTGSNWKEQSGDGLPSADDPVDQEDMQRGGWATRFLLRDMNGDGHLDVAASYYTGPRVWLGDGKGRWKAGSKGLPSITSQGALWGIATGDVNKDGRLDLLVANTDDGPQLFLQQKDGSWQTAPKILPKVKGGAQSVALGDIDGDGNLDMAVGALLGENMNSSYGLFILRGDGKGGWAEWNDAGLPETGLEVIWGMALGDVNKDGRLDLAVTSGSHRPAPKSEASSTLPRVQVWLNESKK